MRPRHRPSIRLATEPSGEISVRSCVHRSHRAGHIWKRAQAASRIGRLGPVAGARQLWQLGAARRMHRMGGR